MKIYAVLSKTQDECTYANRAFYLYEIAYQYMRNTEKGNGCEYYIIALEIEEPSDWGSYETSKKGRIK